MMISAAGFAAHHQPVAMSSRELAELTGATHGEVKRLIISLDSGKRLSRPLRTADYLLADEQPRQEYLLDKRDSLTVVALLSPSFTPVVLDRWQAREQTHDLPDFTNPAAAAHAWAEEFERRQAMETHLAAMAPKARFFDRYVAVDGAMGFRQVCKLLKVKESEFRQFLLERQIMYRLAGVLTPYQQHLDAGRFEVHTGTSGSRYAFSQARFTAKGVKWVADLWATYTVAPQAKGAAA
ncbi:phage antirepressor KilAC domain-containing protein [Candidatus Sodalis sp. SoCistrobi]|uniref:phage antirepressor KilAC domain-containing protein n=1 Tax=Candidatus Sodalis sp. SoCistrobi TaxID=1922216 RepID=UPI00093A8591|nr:phage antirepressor KilAC domain-containing protein [Candidatus Sodalis sp. SoCistrobi]